jgi:hypothetical protein
MHGVGEPSEVSAATDLDVALRECNDPAPMLAAPAAPCPASAASTTVMSFRKAFYFDGASSSDSTVADPDLVLSES